ncbi:hypothetical protein PybrP1_002349, partial [[Pythium] brassicae (nom. inval.)]
ESAGSAVPGALRREGGRVDDFERDAVEPRGVARASRGGVVPAGSTRGASEHGDASLEELPVTAAAARSGLLRVVSELLEKSAPFRPAARVAETVAPTLSSPSRPTHLEVLDDVLVDECEAIVRAPAGVVVALQLVVSSLRAFLEPLKSDFRALTEKEGRWKRFLSPNFEAVHLLSPEALDVGKEEARACPVSTAVVRVLARAGRLPTRPAGLSNDEMWGARRVELREGSSEAARDGDGGGATASRC